MKRLKIIFLTPRFPYPLIGGDRIKSHYLLANLAKQHDVTLVTFKYGTPVSKAYVKEIEKIGVKLHTIHQKPIKTILSTAKRLFTRYPLEILFFTQPEFRAKVDELFEKESFDLGISFFMRTSEYLKEKNIKKILMSEDCRTLYMNRSYDESRNIPQRAVRFWEYRKLRHYEPDIVNHFDYTTLVTPEDVAAMQKQNAKAKFAIVTNGVDFDRFTLKLDEGEKNGILLTGKFDTWANELMVMRIVKDILPLIRKEIPDVTFSIVGARPPASILKLQNKYIKVHENVPEIIPYYHKAQLFLHPHLGGSGIQNKLLEAMGAGCPVVTTGTGNQGIHATHGEEAMIGNSNEELAAHAIKVLKDREFANKLSKNARALMEKTHSWQVVFNQLDTLIEDLFPEK